MIGSPVPYPEPFRPIGSLSQWLIRLLFADAIVIVLTFPMLWIQARAVAPGGGSDQVSRGVGPILEVADAFAPLVLGATIAVWLGWQFRAHANLHAAGVGGLRFSAAWAILWWFVPVANLWQPQLAMGELVQASDAAPGRPKTEGASGNWVALSTMLWWLAFVAGIVATDVGVTLRRVADPSRMVVPPFVGGTRGYGPRSADLMRTGDVWLMVGQVGLLLAAALAAVLVRRVSMRQGRWATQPVPSRPDLP